MKRVKNRLLLGCLAGSLSLLLLGSLPAAAQDRPCAADMQKFCPGIEPGNRQAVSQCLKQHADEISPACRERIGMAKERAMDLKEACGQDIQTLCPNVQPGQGTIMKCLKKNQSQVSPGCKEALAEGAAKRRGGMGGM